MARKPIYQRISLLGADEIRRQFKQLGEAGERAFKDIQREAAANNFADKLSRDIKQLRTFVKQLAADFTLLGNRIKGVGGAFGNFGSAFGRVLGNAARIGATFTAVGVGAAAAGVGLFRFTKTGTENLDELGKTAQAVGLTLKEFAELKFAAEQGGVEQSTFVTGLRRFARAAKEAQDGAAEYLDSFNELGIKVKGANGELKSTNDLLMEVFTALGQMEKGLRRTALANELLGRGGSLFFPLIDEGVQGIANLRAEANRLGLVFTEEQFKNAERYNDAVNRVKLQLESLQTTLSAAVAPALTIVAERLERAFQGNQAAVSKFGEEIGNKLLVRFFILTLQLERASIILKQFFQLVRGEISLSNAVDEASILYLEYLKLSDVFYEIKDAATLAFNFITGVADTAAAALKAVFGVELTGRQLLVIGLILKLTGVFGLLGAAIQVVTALFGLFSPLRAIFVDILAIGIKVGQIFGRFGGAIKTLAASFLGLGKGASFLRVIGAAAVRFLAFIPALIGWPALLVAAVAAAAAAIYIYWDEIKDFGIKAFQQLTSFVDNVWAGIRDGITQAFDIDPATFDRVATVIGNSFTFTGMIENAKLAGSAIVDAFKDVDIRQTISDAITGAKGVFDDFKASVSGTYNDLVTAATTFELDLAPIWERIKGAGEGVWSGITSVANGLWTGITGTFESAITTIGNVVKRIGEAASSAWKASVDSIKGAAETIKEIFTSVTDLEQNAQRASDVTKTLVEPFEKAKQLIEAVWIALRASLQRITVDIANGVANQVSRMVADIERLLARLRAAAAEARRLRAQGSGGDDGGRFASGGFVSGPGTGTSDSIPAWLSNGEFVVRAKAVREYGVRFLDALNRGKLDIGGAPKFSTGGLVQGMSRAMQSISQPMVPRFAEGGLVTQGLATPQPAGRPFTLQIGGQQFDGLTAPEDTAKRLIEFAQREDMKATGRQPLWRRGK